MVRTPAGRLRAGWRLLLYLLALGAALGATTAAYIGIGLPPQMRHGIVRPLPQLASALLVLPVVLLVTALMLRRLERRSLRSIGLGADQPRGRALVLGMTLGAVTPGLVTALLAATRVARVRPEAITLEGLLGATLPMIVAVALLSSWEEIAFRGYTLQLLAEMGGPAVAAGVTGALFGLVHAGNPGANPAGLAITAINGTLLAWVVLRTGSLWLACGYHAGWNLMAALVLGLRDSGTVHGGALHRTELAGPAWLTGGGYGFEGSLLTAAVELVVLGAMIAWAGRLPGSPEARGHYGLILRPALDTSTQEPACPPSSPPAISHPSRSTD
jgi:membrane protease YdiL (CAAX protease family)